MLFMREFFNVKTFPTRKCQKCIASSIYIFRFLETLPDWIYLFGVNNEASICEICVKFKKHACKPCGKHVKTTIKAPEQHK